MSSAENPELPLYFVLDGTHKSLKKVLLQNIMINNLLEGIQELNKNIDKLESNINISIETTKGTNYNYSISGSSAWNNIFNEFTEYLSDYEKSAIHKYNSTDYIYLINTNDNQLILQNIKEQLTNFIKYLQAEFLRINTPGQYYRISLNTESKTRFFFKDAIVFNIELEISNTEFIATETGLLTGAPKRKTAAKSTSTQIPITAIPTTTLLGLIDEPSVIQSSIQPAPASRSRRQTTSRKEKAAAEAAEAEAERQAIKAAKEASRSARAERAASRRRAGGNNDIIKKRIFTFEFNFFNSSDELYVEKNKLLQNYNTLIDPSTHYLDIYGLYIFNYIAKLRYFVIRGNYNIFKIREYIYEKLVLTPNFKTRALFDIVKIYEITFKDLNIPNKYIYNELEKSALLSIPELETFITDTEEKIIEILRPYINKTLININNNIHQLNFNKTFNEPGKPTQTISGNDLSGIFVAGGDAIRRYKFDASKTKDIDSKIYIPADIIIDKTGSPDNYNTIDECITNNLFELLSYLVNNKNTIFESINSPEIILKEGIYNNPDKTYGVTYKAIFKLISDNLDDSDNFRFRKLGKEIFPVDLYSLDYRCKIYFEYTIPHINTQTGEYINTKIIHINKYDIAFLDIVLENKGSENYYKKWAVITKPNDLPISSLEFLIDDLRTTYNSDTSSLLRFLGNKSDKDYKRFQDLLKIYQDKESYYNIIEDDNNIKRIQFLNEPKLKIQNLNTASDDYTYDSRLYSLYKMKYNDKNSRGLKKIIFDYNEVSKIQSLRSSAKVGGVISNITNDDSYNIKLYEFYKEHPQYMLQEYTAIDKSPQIDEQSKIDYVYRIMKPKEIITIENQNEITAKLFKKYNTKFKSLISSRKIKSI